MKKESPSYFGEEAVESNVNSAFQWFNHTARLMSEGYRSQLSSSYGMFNDFFENTLHALRNSFESETNGISLSQKTMSLFVKNLEMFSDLSKDIMKKTTDSIKTKDGYYMLNEDYFDAIYHAYNNQAKHMASINQNFMDIVTKYSKSTQFDYDGFAKNFQKQMQSNMNSSNLAFKNMLNTFDGYKTMPEASGNKMVEEINRQIDLMAKSNIKFWNDLYAAFSKQADENAPTPVKEEVKTSPSLKKQLA